MGVIGTSYRKVLRPVLFELDPESVHERFISIGKLLGSNVVGRNLASALFNFDHPMLESTVCGISFRNPVGLSAGFDKDANLISIMGSVGFGFAEVGTVTHKPYGGNPKPRLYRLPKSKGLVVYYGLKNEGVGKIVGRIIEYRSGPGIKLRTTRAADFVLGASIGKTNSRETSSLKAGVADYCNCLRVFEENGDLVEFYTINISCPNTFGGEPYTTPTRLSSLLDEVREVEVKRPIFLKMPINLKWEDFNKLVEVAVKYKIDALVIGNLNKDHKSRTVRDDIPEGIKGGISGRPTWRLSNELISKTYQKYGDRIKIIGVGGIFSARDAYEKICRGASLVQLITGMIYEGPQLIGEINRGLVELLERDGFENVSEAVGSYYR